MTKRRGFVPHLSCRLLSSLSLAVLLSVSIQASAAVAVPQEAFDQGRAAFDAGDYQGALDYFLEARRQGSTEPHLFFSLGSTFYKLERYEEAKLAFEKSAEHQPLAPLSYLNLGLIAAKQDQQEQAIEWFDRAILADPDSDAAKLSRKMLARLDATPTRRAILQPSFLGIANAKLGYEDQAVSIDENTPADTQTNTFLELFGYGKATLFGTARDGVFLNGTLYMLENDTASTSDIFLAGAGVGKAAMFGDWQTSIDGEYSRTYLGSVDYQSAAELTAKVKIPLGSYYQSYRYQYTHYSALDDRYSYVAGDRHRVRVEMGMRRASPSVKAHYEFEYNNREDRTTATTFSSYSPLRQNVRLTGTFYLSDNWQSDARIDYRNSSYSDENYTATDRYKRQDDRWKFGLEASRSMFKSGRLLFEYEYTNNDSNMPGQTYTRNQFKTGLEWIF